MPKFVRRSTLFCNLDHSPEVGELCNIFQKGFDNPFVRKISASGVEEPENVRREGNDNIERVSAPERALDRRSSSVIQSDDFLSIPDVPVVDE